MSDPVSESIVEPAAEPAKPTKRRRGWRRHAIEALIFIGIIIALQAWQRRNLLDASGEPAPPLVLQTLDGKTVDLADFKGKTVQIHFWATWCGVCQLEHGALNAVQADLSDDRVLLTVVADGKDAKKVADYVAKEGIEYPVLLATDRTAIDAWKVSSFPTNYFVGPDGNLVGRDVGMSTRLGMKARLGCAR